MYKTNFMMMDNNSVKRFKQSKDCEKSLEKNEQEVLVLPPNLLQELGINLGNIQNTLCYPVVKDHFEPNNLQTGEKSKINSEQFDDVAKEVTGLVCEKSVQLSPAILSSNNIPQQKQEYIIANNVASTSNIDHNNININLDQNRKEIDKNTDIQKQCSVESNSDIKYQKKSNVCNNKQSIKIVEFNSLNPQSSHLNSSNGKKSKINIISHEVVKPVSDETFKTLKICPAPRSTFIPFKINTLIERIPKSTSMSDNVTSDTISLEPQFDRDKMLQTNDSACSMHTEENALTTNNLNNYPDIDAADGLVPDTDKEPEANDLTEIYCVINEVDNIREESNLATCTENKTVDIDMSDEMPTPSTSLVSQMSDNTLTDVYEIEIEEVDEDDEIRTEKNNNISENFDGFNISASDKQSIDDSWRNNVIKNPDYMNKSLLEKVKLSSHHLTTKSKLCIQGIEKPGGRIESDELQTDMILRTYLNRQARNEFNSKTGDVILNNELTAKTYEIVDKCTDFNNIDVTCVTKQVSPCNEFGRLQFDDDESECGHFHFLPKNTVQSASSSFETFSEENASNEETFNEADNTYGNDVQINDLSDICQSELSSISENDIPEQLNEDQKLFSSQTYVNLYDECLNDDIKSDDLYSFSTEVKVFNDNLLEQSDPDEEQELFITETHRNDYRRISTVEEVGETSEAYITKKRKRTSKQEEEGILLHSIQKNYYNADAKKNISCVKCAVCRKEVPEVDWDSHLYEEHCYIAWKEGSSIIDLHDDELIKKLSEILEKVKSLYCTFCGQKGRNLNRMLAHFKICITKIFIDTNSNDDVNTKIKSERVKCGVCKMEMSFNDWNDHIQKEHNYLAWKDGDPELNLDDGWKIQIHLQNILNDIGRLVCGKCELVRHYTKSFIKHIKKCDGSRVNYSVSDSVECGVCSQKVAGTEWLDHIYKEHNYLAKIRGAPPLDLSNEDAVKKHLQGIRSITGRLTCAKCGLTRKIIKNFMQHIKECGGSFQKKMNVSTKNIEAQLDNSICVTVRLQYSGTVQCGVCREQVDGAQWLQHIQKEHNYIAWLEGEQPLNFLKEEYIWQYLNDVKKITGVLICVKCGQNRKYGKAYMEHINECDGSKINQDEKFEYPIHRSQNLSISSTEEGGEACITQKRKRTLTEDEGTSLQSTKTIYRNAPDAKKISSCVKCAVCLKEVPEVDWDSHLYENHCHIGWKKGSSIIDLDDKELIQKLSKTLKKDNVLHCTFCGQKKRDLKKFMSHLKICIKKIFTNVNITNANYSEDVKIENDGTVKCEIFEGNVPVVDCTERINIQHVDIKPCIDVLPAATKNVTKIEHDEQEIKSERVKCGVCKMEMSFNDWNDHIQKEHNYLAWKDGDPELDLADENHIYICLLNVVDRIGGLMCGKCGLVRHYPKSFMKHINKCNRNEVNTCHNDSVVVDQSNDDVNQTQEDDTSLTLSDSVECGVCSQKVAGTEWLDHIHKEHNYLAKIRGALPLDLSNEDAVKKHLQGIRSITGRLTCAKCGLKRKIIKNFMEHIKECGGSFQKKMNVSTKNIEAQLDNSICVTVRLQYSGTVQCGVCREQVDGAQWLQHIQKEHNYIAWPEGEQPLNFELEEETWQYLNNVARKAGVLICGKCGLYRKYGKAYMQHVKECDGSKAALVDQLNISQMMENDINSTYLDDCINYGGKVKCGVCAAEVEGARWLQHIQEEHNYMAWVEGRTPLYPEDKEFVNTYLKLIIKHTGALICGKCGLPRKLAKYYLQHVSKCGETKQDAVSGSQDNLEVEENEFVHSAAVQCGECLQQVPGSQWILHIRLKHDYLARIAGKPALDVNDEEQVRNHLSALRKYVDQLICSNCGEGHKHVRAFLKHLQHCDGAEKSDNGSDDMQVEEESFIPNGTVRCGVCRHEVRGEEWINHIHKEHDYMATIEGKPPLILDDEEEIRTHLNTVRRYVRELVCNKCGESRKFVKSYMKHIKNCAVSERVSTDTRVESGQDSVASVATEEDKEFQVEFPGTVVCGVCDREVYGNQWVHHIRTEHNYIAHVKGKTPLDINNNKQIKAHLNAVSKHAGGLYCNKCCLMRLYVKSYLAHVQQCGNSDSPFTVDANNSVMNRKESDESFNPNDTTKVSDKAKNTEASHFVYEGNAICGVCRSEVTRKEWINHIQKQHNYLAWVDGETPLDLEDQEQVHAHLYELSRLQNGLTCNICDAKRKYVKSFLDHIRNCSDITQGGIVECAVCSETMPVEEWRNHAMKNHYNIAWTVGSDPIDLKNPYAVEKYLKEYKKIEKNLICKTCKLTRVSCAGFYAHIITCGKTDEEIEDFKSVCDICNSKYLCIYKNQHLAFHREQEYIKEKKSRALELAQSKAEEGGTPGRRRAAEKAKNVIEDYKSKLNHKCASCSFGTDVEQELEGHVCAASDTLSDSDSASLQLEHSDTDSDVDSDLSMEEEQQTTDKKKRIDTPPKVSHHIPFKLKSSSNYIAQAALDFHNLHYTLDELFPDWKPKGCQEVDAEDLPKYLPTVEESCKVKIGNGDWTTYKRFEAKYGTVISMFVGGSIRCVSWAAARGAAAERSYLAVAGPGAPDTPRLPADQLREHPALIQLWDFGDFQSEPKFVLGLALDYGTVWAMEWCPSGARDCPPHSAGAGAGAEEAGEGHTAEARLGLLALACSNGSVYILSVPHPSHTAKILQIIKITPSVELRLCSSEDRKKYQATAISWSKQKGHAIILVGYADGSTAFYDLGCDSPLLKSVENNITILYPFQDDRPHNTCISDVDMFACGVAKGEGEGGCGGGAWGAWGGASCTGVHAALRAAAPRLHAPLATAATRFTPHWPSLLVTADEAIANYMTNELEWHGGGRRLGGQRALAACARCGAAAALTPPALRLTRTHPAYRDPRRDVVGMLHMVSLAKKRSKHINDELSMKIEPLTYEDAVKEYGIELKLKSQMTKADQQVVVSEAKVQFPERFPLADVPALAFCPAPAAHARLALPTHAGVLFIITV